MGNKDFFRLSSALAAKSKVSELLVAVGWADWIFLLCTEGRGIKFNLLEKRWQKMGRDTLDSSIDIHTEDIYACLVDF